MNLNLKSLIGKLTDTTRRALESAAGLCLSRTHYEIEVEHWLVKLLEAPDGDLARILARFEIDRDRVLRDLDKALGSLKTGNAKTPALSPDIEDLVRDAWVLSSINLGWNRVRSGVLLLAGLADRALGRRLGEASRELQRIKVDVLAAELGKLVQGAPEDREVLADDNTGSRTSAAADGSGAGAGTPALDRFTVNLTAEARAGKIDPVLGRDPEIRQIVDILMRRRQNNPILTGEAGVGKTAVVEGFARRIAADDVPEPLRGVDLRTLDLGLLQAGAGVKGEFENRLKQVIEEVRSSPVPIILFIDEAHTLIGAGGEAGQGDAANLLKPALARGELRTIAATTWAEYKKYFEKDAALTRRFQVVRVEEPPEPTAIEMMRGLTKMLESHHRVRILDEAVQESVRLSARYIPARQLPDKSVSVLDTACARIAIGQAATPPQVEDLRRRIDAIGAEIAILSREAAVGADHGTRLAELEAEKTDSERRLAELEQRLATERGLVTDILERHRALENGEDAPALSDAERKRLVRELDAKKKELAKLQGERPLVQVHVDGQTIAEVISGWTGIPIGKMLADEIQVVLDLPKRLGERVIGQDHALETISRRIRTSRAKLDDPRRPVGVFLLVGPSGVGKTETALSLADVLHGGEKNIVAINMSEYQEAHTVSSLKGSPPGYVGFGEGGVLTNAVRRRPYSVVLLDEVEKAHPDVLELFFQVFDKGVLEDGEGREVDFKNTIILLTSNVGSDKIMALCRDPETMPEPDGLVKAIRPELLQKFPAALLGRMVTVPYFPISRDIMERIIRLQLGKIARRVRDNHRAELVYGEPLVRSIVERYDEPESGARNVDRILTHGLLPQLSNAFLERMARGEEIARVELAAGASGEFEFTIT
jgi:type VI secretion system protein VasG